LTAARRVALGGLAAAGVCVALLAPAGTAAPPPAKLRAALDEAVKQAGYGAIVLVRDGSRTTRLAAGLGRLSPRTPMRPTDRFRVGSVTKTFVSTVLLQLEGEGALSLDDSLERWLPGLVPNGAAITVRRLLNHTSGIYDYTNDPAFFRAVVRDPARVWRPRELVAFAVKHRPSFAPGTSWSYSNTNYVLAGLVVRAVTGHAVRDELRDRIFGPLHLRGTTLPAGPVIAGPHAHGYTVQTGSRVDSSNLNPSWAWTAGAIVSTADDLATFYGALLGGRLLRPTQRRELEQTVQIESPTAAYGLGIFSLRLTCGTVWGHNGLVPGYVTNVLSGRRGHRQVVVFTNTDDLDAAEQGNYRRLIDTAYCG
jgi:D-alanyl-D-alanine carboxypeptidase